ncbi:MAG TPA: hypothetical protein VIY73_02355 [Polyangiaceae bacterium]
MSKETCFPPPPANPASCPTDPTTIVRLSSCTTAGLTCRFGQGSFCTCSPFADAGFAWFCGPDPGCPSARPSLGASCVGDVICYYDDPTGFAEQCQNGTWQVTGIGQP